MRIISRGNLPGDEVFKGNCGHCKTVFECLKHEGIFYAATSQRDEPFVKVTCPVCGQKANAYATGKYEDTSKDNSRWGRRVDMRESGLAAQYADPPNQFDR